MCFQLTQKTVLQSNIFGFNFLYLPCVKVLVYAEKIEDEGSCSSHNWKRNQLVLSLPIVFRAL